MVIHSAFAPDSSPRKGVGIMKIYVGNLPFSVTEDQLRQEFEPYGKVDSASIVKDRYTGQPRGFAFVEMSKRTEAQAAIEALKGKVLDDRTLEVSEARPRSDRAGGSRGYGDGRRGGFGGHGKGRRY